MLPGLEALVVQCAPRVAPQTMLAVVQTESKGSPWALNINGRQRLARQPGSREEAAAWAQWLIARGYSVDLGLAQVNSRHLARFGISAAQLLDPCTNLAAGAAILSEFFGAASLKFGATPAALHAALSAYNTGNYQSGLANGYVRQVYLAAARARTPSTPERAAPLARTSVAGAPRTAAAVNYIVSGSGSGIADSTMVSAAR